MEAGSFLCPLGVWSIPALGLIVYNFFFVDTGGQTSSTRISQTLQMLNLKALDLDVKTVPFAAKTQKLQKA